MDKEMHFMIKQRCCMWKNKKKNYTKQEDTAAVLLTRGSPVGVCSHYGLQTECGIGCQQTRTPCPV